MTFRLPFPYVRGLNNPVRFEAAERFKFPLKDCRCGWHMVWERKEWHEKGGGP